MSEPDATGGSPASPDGAAPPPARVRVTAPRTGSATSAVRRSGVRAKGLGTETGPTDVQAMYVRSLIRSQLRLGLVCAAGFAAATVVFVVAIALTPTLDQAFVAGVPLSWLLLGFGVYPLAITVAALYVRAAARNEARYRSLAEDA